MHNVLKHVRSWFWTSTLLVVMVLTACTPSLAPTSEATPRIMPPMTPSAASAALPLSPSPLPPTPTSTSTPTGPLIIDYIQMTDRTTGWGMGQMGTEEPGRLFRTTDGGASWRDVSPGLRSHYGFSILDAQLAWVRSSDNDEVWRTQDGGQSWSSLGQIQGQFWFNDSQHGWKMDAEAWGLSYVQFDIRSFSTTQDGGETWQEANLPPGIGLAFLAFPDPQTAWAIRAGFAKTIEGVPNLGVPFSLETTADGGRTWGSQEMPLPPEVEVVEMGDGYSYLAAGNCDFDSPVYSSTTIWKMALTCEEQGWLYTSTDQGETWTITSLPAGQVTDVQFIDPSIGWSLRKDEVHPYQSDLYQTTDGGQTWALLAHLNWADAGLDFVDDQTGWAVVVTCDDADCNPYFYPKALAKTTDGGQTWQIIQPQIVP
jgi:photosystem II stability/assembly factor-like uncharacterized protein